MNIFPFKATHPNFELIASPESFFDNVKTEYKAYKENGFYTNEDEIGFYLYTIEKNGSTYSGIVADTEIEDLISRGKIKKHEQTIVSKEQTMMHLILHRQAMVKPVLLAFPEVKEIKELIERLIKENEEERRIKFRSNGETHVFRRVTDKKSIKEIQESFAKKLNMTYIADGHHRASTMSILYGNQKVPGAKEKFNRILTAYFPFNQLKIVSYNRIVDLYDDINPVRFIALISKYFKIDVLEEAKHSEEKHFLTMYINQQWFGLTLKSKVIKQFENHSVVLDSGVFNKIILSTILGIEDVRFDTRIKYISGTKGTKGLVKLCSEKPTLVGFCLPPVSPGEIIKIVDDGRTLPPKSTWFLPRLRSGMIVKEFQ